MLKEDMLSSLASVMSEFFQKKKYNTIQTIANTTIETMRPV
jgi:hypothetical protein